MTDINIRHTEPEDAVDIHEILVSPHVVAGTMRLPYMPLETTKERLVPAPDHLQLTALRGDGIAGFAELLLNRSSPRAMHCGELNMIATHPDHLRKGVCNALLSEVVRLAEGLLGLRRLSLTVWLENEAALDAYRRSGFKEEGHLRSYVRTESGYSDAIIMSRLFDVEE